MYVGNDRGDAEIKVKGFEGADLSEQLVDYHEDTPGICLQRISIKLFVTCTNKVVYEVEIRRIFLFVNKLTSDRLVY